MNQEEEYINIYPNLKRIINICKFKYTVLEIKLFHGLLTVSNKNGDVKFKTVLCFTLHVSPC